MTQETPKRGRPRKQPVVETVGEKKVTVVEPTTTTVESDAIKAPKIRRTVAEKIEQYTTFIAPKGGIALRIPTDKVNVFDKETGKVRAMRYCPGEHSIWKDEQSEAAQMGHIVFRNKMLTVSPSQPNLLNFLLNHPYNQKNGGVKFKIVEKEKDDAKTVDTEFLVHDAITLIKERGIDQLLPVAMALKININQKNIAIKRDMVTYAKRYPQKFIDMFDNPLVNARSTVMQAFDFQIVRDRGGAVVWYDTGKMIAAVPVGQDPVEVLTRFCLTDSGASVLIELERQLEDIA